jgi:hypothetical protein
MTASPVASEISRVIVAFTQQCVGEGGLAHAGFTHQHGHFIQQLNAQFWQTRAILCRHLEYLIARIAVFVHVLLELLAMLQVLLGDGDHRLDAAQLRSCQLAIHDIRIAGGLFAHQ